MKEGVIDSSIVMERLYLTMRTVRCVIRRKLSVRPPFERRGEHRHGRVDTVKITHAVCITCTEY